MFADFGVDGIGEHAELSGVFLVLAVELDHLRLVGVGPRAENHLAHNAEDGGIDPDAQRQGDHSHGREAGRTGQSAECETEVPDDVLQKAPSLYGPDLLLDLLQAAEFHERLATGR